MKIEYKSTKTFTEKELQRLFLSVNWESGNYPDKLVRAMQHSTHVISAWDGNKCYYSQQRNERARKKHDVRISLLILHRVFSFLQL